MTKRYRLRKRGRTNLQKMIKEKYCQMLIETLNKYVPELQKSYLGVAAF